MLEGPEADIGDRAVDVLDVERRQAALRIGVSAEGDEVAHAEARGDVVVLAHDRQAAGEHVAGGAADIEAVDQNLSPIHRHQAADDRQQRRFSGAVRTYDRGQAPCRKRRRDPVDDCVAAVGSGDVANFDHRAEPRTSRKMKTRPPTNSMTMLSAVLKANSRSRITWPPTSVTMARHTAIGSTKRWLAVGVICQARLATRRPKNVTGPTRAVETETRTAMSTSRMVTVR
ncbi:hypothetical protein D3C87_1558450 [compost metagenome]